MTNQQLELVWGEANSVTMGGRRESRIQRAAWWFARMREAVNEAIDWQPAGEPRPEQIWLPGTHREARV